jgi:hypothetical protein
MSPRRIVLQYDETTGSWPPHPEAPVLFVGGDDSNPPTGWGLDDLWVPEYPALVP